MSGHSTCRYAPLDGRHPAPLAVFRILFGVLMFISLLRFAAYGWIEKFYIEPKFFFSYYGFSWVQPLGHYTYLLFAICMVSAVCVTIGYRYRISIVLFFLSFTYIELIDKTTYLNHYYFISCLAFLMIFLPAGQYYSIDEQRSADRDGVFVPRWSIDAIKLLLGIVYFYAGIAKLNSDWLLEAMPLKIWLSGRYDIPLIGGVLQQEWMAYAFSWGGALYDLMIPFLLLWSRTRGVAFILVVVFHVLTRILFPIGMFPYIMIVSTLIFFDEGLHKSILRVISKVIRVPVASARQITADAQDTSIYNRLKYTVVILFFAFQILFPLRNLLYPGSIFWTEEGYRYSWRVMLMEKAGYANFKIVDGKTGNRFYVDNTDFLSSQQEKMMSTQPDMILQYAHFLGKKFADDGHQNVEVYVESYVALNGNPSQPYIDPDVDLMNIEEGWAHKTWILPRSQDQKQ